MPKLWIFPVNKQLNSEAQKQLANTLSESLQQWNRHGEPVKGHFQIVEQQFIQVESEEEVCGCASDQLHRLVRESVERNGLQTLSPAILIFENPETKERFFIPFNQVEKAIKEGKITPETYFFDLSVLHQNTLEKFKKRVKESWLYQRYFRMHA